MMYQIEFIRYVDGRSEPTVVERINAESPTLQAAIDKAVTLFGTLQAIKDADGFQIRENGQHIVARRSKGEQ